MQQITNNQNFTALFSPQLTQIEKTYVSATDGLRMREMHKNEVCSSLIELLTKAYFDSGQKHEGVKFELLVESIYPDFDKYFNLLTLKEVALAFHLGVRKEYGEYMGINPTTVFNWLKGFVADAKRMEAKKKQASYLAELNKPKELTPEEKELKIKEGVLALFDEAKNGNSVIDFGNVTYDWLNTRKLIPFTIERKKEILSEAQKKIRANLHKESETAISSTERMNIRAKINALAGTDKNVQAEAKRMALNIFFKELIENDVELTDLITEYENENRVRTR